MDYLKAFLIGGLICAMVQILIDKTKLLPGRIMVGLVVTGSILCALDLYEPLLDFAGAGATVPLTGFGYNLAKGAKLPVDTGFYVWGEIEFEHEGLQYIARREYKYEKLTSGNIIHFYSKHS